MLVVTDLYEHFVFDDAHLRTTNLLYNPVIGAWRGLHLDGNPGISNIQPLLDNTGFGAGDRVDLQATNVSCTDVAALEAKGMTVSSACS